MRCPFARPLASAKRLRLAWWQRAWQPGSQTTDLPHEVIW